MTSSEKVEEKLSVLKNQGLKFDVDLGFMQRKVQVEGSKSCKGQIRLDSNLQKSQSSDGHDISQQKGEPFLIWLQDQSNSKKS